jgi:chitin disaccharide deacetylase
VSRALIVNADDLGRSNGINGGIALAHESGIVTSASLMVRGPAAEEAAAWARTHPAVSVGLHLDLGEWVYERGAWRSLYVVTQTEDAAAVEAEIGHQLLRFRRLVGREPTHLDSHQHVHRQEPVHAALRAAARRLDVPLRSFSPRVRYDGSFYGQTGTGDPFPQAVSVDALVALVSALPAGITELGCHPGLGDDAGSSYGRERELEVRALCDVRVRDALSAGCIELRSFHGLRLCEDDSA